MPLPLYHVDAFTSVPFRGNPAAVVILDEAHASRARDAAWMQSVAADMNLSETAFAMPTSAGRWALRWFTPTHEVPLCGHATLATGAVLHARGEAGGGATFDTASGPLHVALATGNSGRFAMSLPAYGTSAVDSEASELVELLGCAPIDVRISDSKARKLMVVVATEHEVLTVAPRAASLLAAANPHDVKGVIVTARSDAPDVDFVSRFFAPWLGVDEDPVTGSAHAVLGPYWAQRLERTKLRAVQRSKRRGELDVSCEGDRVILGGACAIVARGELLA